MGADSQEEDDDEDEDNTPRLRNHRQEGDNEEIELAGHSEKILGTLGNNEMNNFSRMDDIPLPAQQSNQDQTLKHGGSRYPDQSFVNLNDSFSQNAFTHKKQAPSTSNTAPYLKAHEEYDTNQSNSIVYNDQ